MSTCSNTQVQKQTKTKIHGGTQSDEQNKNKPGQLKLWLKNIYVLRQYILTDTHHSTVKFKTTPNDMFLHCLFIFMPKQNLNYIHKLFGVTPMAPVVSPGISPLRTA